MLIFIYFSVLVTVIKAESLDRIINGKIVDISDYPYQVALVAQRHNRKRIICGGALVKPHVVFTAAHCTHARDYSPRENLAVLVGADYLGDPKGKIHKIEKVRRHPDFSYDDYDHDFSIVVLEKPVRGGHAQPISISSNDDHGGKTATASGWGLTEFGAPSKYLRAADLTVENWEKCQDYFPGVFHPKITRNMICVKPGSTTTYFGDSGGPLTIDGELIGLVSFGRKLGAGKKVTVFTRVKNFLDFADEVISDNKDDDSF